MEASIRCEGVSKWFAVGRRGQRRRVSALEAVSFSVAAGECVACVGSNGAGKATTGKILTGILHPSAGAVEVAGHSPQRQRVQVARRIGAVFGQRTQLWWDLPVRDSFELIAAMYGVPEAIARPRLRALDDVLDLAPLLSKPVRQLSLGQRMRADLAAALLHAPPVLFLDEPTVGLDIVAREAVRRFLREVHRTGTTVLLTTHDMGDVEQLCPRVLALGGGRLVYDGPTAGLPSVATVEFTEAAPRSRWDRWARAAPWCARPAPWPRSPSTAWRWGWGRSWPASAAMARFGACACRNRTWRRCSAACMRGDGGRLRSRAEVPGAVAAAPPWERRNRLPPTGVSLHGGLSACRSGGAAGWWRVWRWASRCWRRGAGVTHPRRTGIGQRCPSPGPP